MISVIIPHKNSTRKLNRLLGSLTSAAEVIVVDDDSSMIEKSSLKELQEVYDFLVVANTGPEFNAGVARNIGLNHASGNWVIFADADDFFDKEGLESLIDELPCRNEDVIIFGCEALLEETGLRSDRCDSYIHLLEKWPENSTTILYEWVVPWGKAIKREILVKNGIVFESLLASNDVGFSTDLASFDPSVGVFKKQVYYCTESSTSLTGSLTSKKAEARLLAGLRRNKVLYHNNVSVPFAYNLKYFVKSFPILVSRRKFSVLKDFSVNLFLASYMNLVSYLKKR